MERWRGDRRFIDFIVRHGSRCPLRVAAFGAPFSFETSGGKMCDNIMEIPRGRMCLPRGQPTPPPSTIHRPPCPSKESQSMLATCYCEELLLSERYDLIGYLQKYIRYCTIMRANDGLNIGSTICNTCGS